jgi:hypothetical protein
MMAITIISALGGVAGLGSFVCWILVLIKMFQTEKETIWKPIVGIVTFGIYAIIWGWQNQPEKVGKNLIIAFTALYGASFAANIIVRVLLASAMATTPDAGQ